MFLDPIDKVSVAGANEDCVVVFVEKSLRDHPKVNCMHKNANFIYSS